MELKLSSFKFSLRNGFAFPGKKCAEIKITAFFKISLAFFLERHHFSRKNQSGKCKDFNSPLIAPPR